MGLYVNINYLFVLLFGNNFLFLSIRTLNSSPPLFVPSRKKIITTKDDERSALINPLLPRSTVIPVGNKDSRSWINATIPFAVCTRAPLHLQRLARTFIGYRKRLCLLYTTEQQTANAYKLAAACKFARVAFHRLSTSSSCLLWEGDRPVNEISDLCVFNFKRMEETPSCLSFYASVGTVVERVVGKYRCRLLRYVVVTASKRNFLEILPLLSAPPHLPPLPSFVLTGVDARNTRVGGREGRRCLFSVRIHHEEEQKERRSGLSSKVLELLDAPTSFPLLLVLDYSLEGASGGRWSLSPSRSLSLSSFRLSRIAVKQTAYLALSRQTAAIRRIINNTLHAAFDGRQTNSRARCGMWALPREL